MGLAHLFSDSNKPINFGLGIERGEEFSYLSTYFLGAVPFPFKGKGAFDPLVCFSVSIHAIVSRCFSQTLANCYCSNQVLLFFLSFLVCVFIGVFNM